MNSRMVAGAVLVVATAACTHQEALDSLDDEPLLQAPPGGTELLRTDTAGRSFGFQSPARIEIVCGVPDHDTALAWYLDRHEEAYLLDQQGTETRYLGGRLADGLGVTASLHTYEDISGCGGAR